MLTRLTAIICLFMLSGIQVYASEDGIIVWKLEAKRGVHEQDIDSISGILTDEVETNSGKKVFSEAAINTLLKGEEKRQKCGVADTSCIAEIGNALGVPEAVSGDLGKVGSYWILNMRRIDIEKAEVINRVSRRTKGSIDKLIELMPSAVAELFDKEVATPVVAPVVAKEPESPKESKPVVTEPVEKSYPMNPYKIAGHATFWPGIALWALGGVSVVLAKNAGDEYKNTGDSDYYDDEGTFMGLAYTSFAIGTAAVVTGIVCWALSPGDKEWAERNTVSIVPTIAPNNEFAVSITGRW